MVLGSAFLHRLKRSPPQGPPDQAWADFTWVLKKTAFSAFIPTIFKNLHTI
jgi:hypothetical protein